VINTSSGSSLEQMTQLSSRPPRPPSYLSSGTGSPLVLSIHPLITLRQRYLGVFNTAFHPDILPCHPTNQLLVAHRACNDHQGVLHPSTLIVVHVFHRAGTSSPISTLHNFYGCRIWLAALYTLRILQYMLTSLVRL
jgi:hypothetical protein